MIKVSRKGVLELKRDDVSDLRVKRYVQEGDSMATFKVNPRWTESVAQAHGAVSEWLEGINGKARTRTASVSDVVWAIDELEGVIGSLRTARKAMDRVEIVIDPNGQKFPSAYKFSPCSTVLYVAVSGGGYTVRASREVCRRNRDARFANGIPQAVMDSLRNNW